MQFEFRPYCRQFRPPLCTSHGVWHERRGIILRVEDEVSGAVGYGEIAPLPWFGTETWEAAIAFCQSLPRSLTEPEMAQLPGPGSATQFAWGSVLASLRGGWVRPEAAGSAVALPICTLLPTGAAALVAGPALWQKDPGGTFKWKIGVTDFESEQNWLHRLRGQLPATARLRLDANGGLTQADAERWLVLCDGMGIEFLEQPLPPDQFEAMLLLSDRHATPLALDESVANLAQLRDCHRRGWRGIFVVKGAIAGCPQALLDFCIAKDLDVVFSSVFETGIGRQAVLELAQIYAQTFRQRRSAQAVRALGFGVEHWLEPDGLNPGDATQIWNHLTPLHPTRRDKSRSSGAALDPPGMDAVALDPVALLLARSQTPWFLEAVHGDHPNPQAEVNLSMAIAQDALALRDDLRTHSPTAPILLMAAQPRVAIVWLSAAISAGVPIFLGNPRWTGAELEQVVQTIRPWMIAGIDCFPGLVSQNGSEYALGAQKFTSFPQQFKSFPQACGKLSEGPQPQNYKDLSPPCRPPCQAPPVENLGVFVLTGGSSGAVRFVRHTWPTLLASAAGLRASNLLPVSQSASQSGFKSASQSAFKSIDSFCVLPLCHVSGLMQWVRSLTSGGRFTAALGYPTTELLQCFPQLQPETYLISLVPTQLQRILQDEITASWLARFRVVFLGGAPAWPSLLAAARARGIPLAPTYGMTETASQVATLAPADFGAGQTGCGRVLPHAQIEICDALGQPLPPEAIGAVRVRSQSLATGYQILTTRCSSRFEPFPEDATGPYLLTDDLGFLDTVGSLHIVGRSSDKIISGGENVFPAEVEAAIQSTGWVADVVVLGLPDADWGERVVAVYVAIAQPTPPDLGQGHDLETALRRAIAQQLTPAKRPKTWIAVAALPRNAQGKLNRQALRDQLLEQQASPEDSGPEDSGPEDSGPEDSGPKDSGPKDSGPEC